MLPTRIIARLDIKGQKLIKGIHLEGWRPMGNPNERSLKYYKQGVDEIIYLDAVANLYNRNLLLDIVKKTSDNVFIPITVGGGIRSVDDAYQLLRVGADKIAVNTGAIKKPELITEIAKKLGKQCVVASIEAKKKSENNWEAYMDSAREPTGMNVMEWAKRLVELGAGELLVTSVDKDGTRKGFDVELIKEIKKIVNIPVIAGGGYNTPSDFVNIVNNG